MGDENERASEIPERRLPTVFYNTMTVAGAWIGAISLLFILFFMVVESTAEEHSPYTGILTFIVMPVFLIAGLTLVFVGALRERRRRAHGAEASQVLPVVDLNRSAHLRAVTLIGIGAVIFLMLSSFGSFKAYQYTETNAFCGRVCHAVMEPEYTAYQDSAHARVDCVECHIGPGAEWFVRSKLSGAYQVYAVMADTYPRPIPTPIESLRPSADTCEQCHWPAHFYEENLVTHDYYLPDDENTHMSLSLLMKIGGGSDEHGLPTRGIHWHMNIRNVVEYVATDERRQEIPWVRVTYPDGTQREFVDEEAEFDVAAVKDSEIRKMDCIDCHNRPSHEFAHPSRAVNQAMARGEIDPSIPGIKRVAVAALEGQYGTKDAGHEAIEAALRVEYEGRVASGDVAEKALGAAVDAVKRIYAANYFPRMKASWKAFPDDIGHLTAPGCFRCHDGMHTSEDGKTVTRDCTICHTLLSQSIDEGDEQVSLVGVDYQHPEDIGGVWEFMDCTECHAPR